MLTLQSSPRGTVCDGTSRREFLTLGSLGLAGLSLATVARASTARPKSVVWLWLGGGASQIETFDPKPDAPAEFRSTTGSVASRLPGVRLGGTFPRIAAAADRFAFVRSFAHGNSGHGGGTHWVMTGYDYPQADNGAAPIRPGLGAITARYRGATTPAGLPNYVRTGEIFGDGPVWLGRPFAPFDVRGNARQNMTLRQPLDRLNDRRGLLHAFDTLQRDLDRTGHMAGLDGFETQAFDLIAGRAKEAFELSREAPRLRDAYGPGLGERILLARRLCEAGVGFVTVGSSGWDHHGSIANGYRNQAPAVDRAVRAFVDDLADRGMTDDVLLVITGEFGRTPKVNSAAGRDHWAPLSTLALSGGGLKMGQVVGESTSRGETPKSRPISPQDLMATVCHVLGLPPELQYADPTGRPTLMVETGRPIGELV